MRNLSSEEKRLRLRQHFLSTISECRNGRLSDNLKLVLREPANPSVDPDILRGWLDIFGEYIRDPHGVQHIKEEIIAHVTEVKTWRQPGTPQRKCSRQLLQFLSSVSQLGTDFLHVLSAFMFANLSAPSHTDAPGQPSSSFSSRLLKYRELLARSPSNQYVQVTDSEELVAVKAELMLARPFSQIYVGYSRADDSGLSLFGAEENICSDTASGRFSGLVEIFSSAGEGERALIDSAWESNRREASFLRELVSIIFLADEAIGLDFLLEDLSSFRPRPGCSKGQLELANLVALSFCFPSLLRPVLSKCSSTLAEYDMRNSPGMSSPCAPEVEFLTGIILLAYCRILGISAEVRPINQNLASFFQLLRVDHLPSTIASDLLKDIFRMFFDQTLKTELPFSVQFLPFFVAAQTLPCCPVSGYVTVADYFFSKLIASLTDPSLGTKLKKQSVLYIFSFLRSLPLPDEASAGVLDSLFNVLDAATLQASQSLSARTVIRTPSEFTRLPQDKRSACLAKCENGLIVPILHHLGRLFADRREGLNTEILVHVINLMERFCQRHACFIKLALESAPSLQHAFRILQDSLNAPSLSHFLSGLKAGEEVQEAEQAKGYLRASSRTTICSVSFASSVTRDDLRKRQRTQLLEKTLSREAYPFEHCPVEIYSLLFKATRAATVSHSVSPESAF